MKRRNAIIGFDTIQTILPVRRVYNTPKPEETVQQNQVFSVNEHRKIMNIAAYGIRPERVYGNGNIIKEFTYFESPESYFTKLYKRAVDRGRITNHKPIMIKNKFWYLNYCFELK